MSGASRTDKVVSLTEIVATIFVPGSQLASVVRVDEKKIEERRAFVSLIVRLVVITL